MAMMGGGGPQKRGRNLNAELNLVPYIDLLSVCICFLLITAVWIQIGVVEVKQSVGTSASESKGPYALDVTFKSPTSLDLIVKKKGRVVKRFKVKADDVDGLVANLETSLGKWGAVALKKTPKLPLGTIVSSAMVTPIKGLPYGDMVSVMDVLREHKILNLGVVPTRG